MEPAGRCDPDGTRDADGPRDPDGTRDSDGRCDPDGRRGPDARYRPDGNEIPDGKELPTILLQRQGFPSESAWHKPCSGTSGMDRILSFRDLDVWQLAMDLVDSVIADLRMMPRIEFDLKRQMQRAAIAIPSNIAEGWRRKRRRAAYQNHVSIAMGSQGELETQMEIAFRNGFLKREQCAKSTDLCGRVGLMQNRLHDCLDC